MKICLLGKFNSTEELSGPEKVAKRLFHNLLSGEVDVFFIEYMFKFYERSNFFRRLVGKQIISNEPLIYRAGILQIIAIIIKERPDIVHIVMAERFVLIVLFLKLIFRFKVVSTIHGLSTFEVRQIQKRSKKFELAKIYILERALFIFSDRLIFVSELLHHFCQKKYNIEHGTYSIIPNGVDEIFYDSKSSKNFEGKLKVVFYLGDIIFINRGLDFLITILHRIKFQKFEFYILGKPLVKNIDIEDLHYVPIMPTEELALFLYDKHIVFKSNSFDTFSIFVAECMSMGLIPIISDNAGIKKYIIQKKNGFVYKSNDINSVLKILSDISSSKFNLSNISFEATKIYEDLNWTKIAEMYKNEYLLVHSLS